MSRQSSVDAIAALFRKVLSALRGINHNVARGLFIPTPKGPKLETSVSIPDGLGTLHSVQKLYETLSDGWEKPYGTRRFALLHLDQIRQLDMTSKYDGILQDAWELASISDILSS